MNYQFDIPLKEGLILSRINRFIMNVLIGDNIYNCHCPTTGRIGELKLNNIPCLLSESSDPKRSTKYTVEAISENKVTDCQKSWVGINQTKVNKYIEFFLRKNCFDKIIDTTNLIIKREHKIGESRIDFLISDNVLLEIKMPLIHYSREGGETSSLQTPFNSFDRLIKHFLELRDSLKTYRTILILVYLYDAPRFKRPELNKYNEEILRVAKLCVKQGVEQWQINLSINQDKVSLLDYFQL